ncbi:MAG TPA: hypothetical protein VE442_19290 [Jatrophihabitans sp.]|jgi:hypothetical protein|nr:hypothetical protein [Jatrophihabitans sp.]
MDDAERISFLDARCPAAFRLRRLILQPQDAIDYRSVDWIDTLVIVERGQLELETGDDARAWFAEGAVLVLADLGVQRLRNASDTPLVLSALSR